MERKCNCNDWIDNIDKLLRAKYLYVHGILYDGPLLRFCPWCGTVLSNVPLKSENTMRIKPSKPIFRKWLRRVLTDGAYDE